MKALILLLLFGIYAETYAIPQYSMLTGNKCVNCHASPQGAGARSELGWYSRKDVSIFKPSSIGLGGAYSMTGETNSYYEGKMSFGFDFRYETAKMGGPVNSVRKFFIMQAAPYLVVSPLEWLRVGGHVNFAEAEYPGQQSWSAFALIQPRQEMPYLRVGFIQPSIGNRFDDHTLLIRQVADLGRPNQLIPPDYAEYGAELGYDGTGSYKWLSVSAGAFTARSLSELTLMSDISGRQEHIVDKNSISALTRISFWPRFFDDKINTNIGVSFLYNKDYLIGDAYVHAGLTDHVSLIGEYMYSDKKDLRRTDNYLLMLSYQLLNGFMLEGRYEIGMTENKLIERTYQSNQYVLGAHIVPLPFIEFRPEFRIYDRKAASSYSSQWAVQLHVFY